VRDAKSFGAFVTERCQIWNFSCLHALTRKLLKESRSNMELWNINTICCTFQFWFKYYTPYEELHAFMLPPRAATSYVSKAAKVSTGRCSEVKQIPDLSIISTLYDFGDNYRTLDYVICRLVTPKTLI
jgi:hypothetical protein